MVRAAVHTIAALVGFAIIGCVVDASIMASGGYATSAAPLLVALGCGLAIGSIAVGMAWGDRRWFVTAGLVIALVAGEAYALLLTAERVTGHREAQQAPLKEQAATRAKAAQRAANAEQALADASKDTPRLTRALAAKKAADEAAIGKSAEVGCAKNCRALLEQQVTAAAAEVESARTEAVAVTAAARRELVDARAAFDRVPSMGSPSPLADRLGIAGWELDLTAAALASVAANGLASMLITFGVHGVIVARRHAQPVTLTAAGRSTTQKQSERDPDAEAERFARASLIPCPMGRVYLRDLPGAYGSWCQRQECQPLPGREMATALKQLFQTAGLHTEGNGVDTVIVGIDWKPGRASAPMLLQVST